MQIKEAYTYQKAEEYIKTGRFNHKAASTQTLLQYGKHFATRIKDGHAYNLLDNIVDELYARRSTLSRGEIVQVNDFYTALQKKNPMMPELSDLCSKVASIETQVQSTQSFKTYLDIKQAYKADGLSIMATEADICSFVKDIDYAMLTSTGEEIAISLIMMFILITNTIIKKANMTRSVTIDKIKIVMNNDIIMYFKVDNKAGTFSIKKSGLFKNITPLEIKQFVEGDLNTLINIKFNTGSCFPLIIDSEIYQVNDFYDLYKSILAV